MSETVYDRDYEIRPFRPGDEDGILTSFNRVFREVCGPDYVDRKLAFWRWEFEQCPFGQRIWVAKPEGEDVIAAHYAGVPYPIHTGFGAKTFVHAVDSFVVPEHRAGLKRPGLFVTTARPWFDACRDGGDALVYGYPVRTAERIGQRYLGYTFFRSIRYLCRPAGDGSIDVPAGLRLERLDGPLGADVDALFARVADAAGADACLTRRDARFLNWRWVDIPDGPATYEVWGVRRDAAGGELAGLAVLRVEHELVPGACTIADWVAPATDDDVVAALLAGATARAREAGRERVMAVFAEPAAEWSGLLARGFDVVPSSDYLERRLGENTFDSELDREWLERAWWYTLGDSDLV